MSKDEGPTYEEVETYLRSVGMALKKIPKDGACLFRAVSDQLFHTQSKHLQLRERTIDYLEAHEEDFAPFVDEDVSFAHYVQLMRLPNQWAGQIEIQCLSLQHQVNFLVYQSVPAVAPVRVDNGFTRELRLNFSGNHYDVVYPVATMEALGVCQSLLLELIGAVCLEPTVYPCEYSNVEMNRFLENRSEQLALDSAYVEGLAKGDPTALGFYTKQRGEGEWSTAKDGRRRGGKNAKGGRIDLASAPRPGKQVSLAPAAVEVDKPQEVPLVMDFPTLGGGRKKPAAAAAPAVAVAAAIPTPVAIADSPATGAPTGSPDAGVAVAGKSTPKAWGQKKDWSAVPSKPIASPAGPTAPPVGTPGQDSGLREDHGTPASTGPTAKSSPLLVPGVTNTHQPLPSNEVPLPRPAVGPAPHGNLASTPATSHVQAAVTPTTTSPTVPSQARPPTGAPPPTSQAGSGAKTNAWGQKKDWSSMASVPVGGQAPQVVSYTDPAEPQPVPASAPSSVAETTASAAPAEVDLGDAAPAPSREGRPQTLDLAPGHDTQWQPPHAMMQPPPYAVPPPSGWQHDPRISAGVGLYGGGMAYPPPMQMQPGLYPGPYGPYPGPYPSYPTAYASPYGQRGGMGYAPPMYHGAAPYGYPLPQQQRPSTTAPPANTSHESNQEPGDGPMGAPQLETDRFAPPPSSATAASNEVLSSGRGDGLRADAPSFVWGPRRGAEGTKETTRQPAPSAPVTAAPSSGSPVRTPPTSDGRDGSRGRNPSIGTDRGRGESSRGRGTARGSGRGQRRN